jgi:hypothetical protein
MTPLNIPFSLIMEQRRGRSEDRAVASKMRSVDLPMAATVNGRSICHGRMSIPLFFVPVIGRMDRNIWTNLVLCLDFLFRYTVSIFSQSDRKTTQDLGR